ncbi:MAG: tRNA pseudouridine(55) synthase TruB, partial [Campylobacterota bacterium]|nr:tRNA pseudouridine(55) synthase TruB [Campylobacterota bacterium]
MATANLNRLFVVNKPIFRSSNGYMGYVKRKYGTKKVGFSGTLDPFATGCLIVATGQYTKLFQFLSKTPKSYKATLWLGASSDTLDIEHISNLETTQELDPSYLDEVLQSFVGKLEYLPPKYSAKKINGQRAYDLARAGKEIELKKIQSTIYGIKLLNYSHPFVHFEATVSEGTYIRSLGQLIADKLGLNATLSSLHRINEGKFKYEDEKALNPFEYLAIPNNECIKDEEDIELGKKIDRSYFKIQEEGVYLVETENFFAIIEIDEEEVKYRLNRLE